MHGRLDSAQLGRYGQPIPLSDRDLPALFRAADNAARSGQKTFLWITRVMLLSGLLAALAAVLMTRIQAASVFAAAFFIVGAGAAIWIYFDRPERRWYEARAIAESAKTLAWQYAVGGGRFPGNEVDSGAGGAFADALEELLKTSEFAVLPRGGIHITERMRTLRGADLDTRRATYLDDRIEGQRAWYESRAHWNRRWSEGWRLAMIMLELGGVALAIVAFFVSSDILVGFLGVLAAAGASAVAWHQTRDHETLAEAYSIAAHDLSLVKERTPVSPSEAEWAEFVGDAEQAISREHTLWRARRSRPLALLAKGRPSKAAREGSRGSEPPSNASAA